MKILELTLSLLDGFELEGKYANLALSSHSLDSLRQEQKGIVTMLFYTTLEHKITLDYYICSYAKRGLDSIDIHTLNILRLGITELLYVDSIPDHAAVNECVSLGRNKGERGFINAILRKVKEGRDGGSLPAPEREKSPVRYLSVKYSFPQWLCRHFIDYLGEGEAEELLAHFNKQTDTDITVNTVKITPDGLAEKIREQGYTVKKSSYTPISLRISGSVDPRRLYGFDEGLFIVQDESCAISAAVLSPEAGERIVDVCACPGGKSLAASILTQDGASITSFDLHESKLSLIRSSADRLGIRGITVDSQDATSPRKELFASFDRVICDVPCSGLGVLGKKADMRYKDESGISSLPQLQYQILSSSAKYLRTGGTLVYSTCTLNREENEQIVERFLLENEGFSPLEFALGELQSSGGMLTLMPHRHRMDGFFLAKLIRVK
ncbi:MAG: 16S rRNA (cytosine(967)-C(5))-methyltransferase RsmB [Clostridia bacterium]|nr:16S rRNA (cytosine(967)-C(5))-methyltransferase RsmB [Clostridia bacterium]